MFLSAGTINGTLVNRSGAQFSPGNSPGLATATRATLLPGSTFIFDVNDATAGAGTGWDLLPVSTLLDLGFDDLAENFLKVGQRINIALNSFNGVTPGTASGFVNTNSYSWQFDSAGTVQFNNDDPVPLDVSPYFNVVNGTSGFVGADPGQFNVSLSGNSLFLNYTRGVVPEPSTIVIWSMFGAGLVGWRRRRKPAAATANTDAV